MKRKRLNKKQIIFILKEVEAGGKNQWACRECGIRRKNGDVVELLESLSQFHIPD